MVHIRTFALSGSGRTSTRSPASRPSTASPKLGEDINFIFDVAIGGCPLAAPRRFESGTPTRPDGAHIPCCWGAHADELLLGHLSEQLAPEVSADVVERDDRHAREQQGAETLFGFLFGPPGRDDRA